MNSPAPLPSRSLYDEMLLDRINGVDVPDVRIDCALHLRESTEPRPQR